VANLEAGEREWGREGLRKDDRDVRTSIAIAAASLDSVLCDARRTHANGKTDRDIVNSGHARADLIPCKRSATFEVQARGRI
jgi:hypothetical protein